MLSCLFALDHYYYYYPHMMTTLLVTLAQSAVTPGHKDEALFNKIVFCKQ